MYHVPVFLSPYSPYSLAHHSHFFTRRTQRMLNSFRNAEALARYPISALVLIAATYAICLYYATSTWIPPHGIGLEALLAITVVWAMLLAALAVWHRWKVVFAAPQFPYFYGAYALLELQMYCPEFKYCVS